ncbi:MAG: hypothetical protein IJ989_01465 [Paludibacteraceae bacterium]|nr:hypothetical protein [Paludibacteraceae bacterium]
MKKLSFFLMAMLITFGATNTSAIAPEDTVLWGENFAHFGTKTPSNAGTGSGTTIYDGASITYTQSSTNTKGYNEKLAGGTAPELLLSKSNQTWTISGIKTGGATEMSLTFLSNKTTFSVTVSSASLSVSGSEKKWTISLKDGETAPETFNLTIKNTGSSNARIDNVELKVTVAGVESGAETVELPVFSVTEANFTEAFNLTITSAEGTTLKYTLDNSNPKESATAVVVESNTATIAIPAKSTIVRAVAVKGDLVSGVKSMTYCYINSAETAYTVTEALAIYNEGLGLSNKLYIKGSVKSIEELSTEFGNATYTITDGESDLYIFRGINLGGEKFTSADQLFVGDDLVLYGQLTSYNGNPQVAANSEIISRESKTKSILAEDLTFDAIALGDEVEAQTLTVIGANLTAEITATLDNEKFTVTPATLPAAGGDLTITPAADLTVGEHTATLTLTSGETVKEVALSILVKDVYSINWSVNGTIANETKVVAGDKLVLPTAPAAPDACSEKVFVGWATTSTVNADGSEIEYVTSATVPAESTTYYAVFATQKSEGSQEEVTITPSAVTATEPYSYTLDKDGFTLTAVKNDGSTAPTYNANNEDVRVYAKGTLTLTATNAMSTIVFNLSEQGKKRLAPITASVGTITTQATNDATVTWTGNATEVTFTVGDKANYGSDGDGKAGQLCFTSITVTSGTPATYTNYSTTCDGTSTDIENIAVEGKAVKAIVNGQLIIVKDGVKFNALGQVIK